MKKFIIPIIIGILWASTALGQVIDEKLMNSKFGAENQQYILQKLCIDGHIYIVVKAVGNNGIAIVQSYEHKIGDLAPQPQLCNTNKR
jgi:hypothetical protein